MKSRGGKNQLGEIKIKERNSQSKREKEKVWTNLDRITFETYFIAQ